MTNLHSIFKSKDITLPTKVRIVKAMVFPVVIYGCESWTVKKAERRRIDGPCHQMQVDPGERVKPWMREFSLAKGNTQRRTHPPTFQQHGV